MRISVAQEKNAAGYYIRFSGEKSPKIKPVVIQGTRKRVGTSGKLARGEAHGRIIGRTICSG